MSPFSARASRPVPRGRHFWVGVTGGRKISRLPVAPIVPRPGGGGSRRGTAVRLKIHLAQLPKHRLKSRGKAASRQCLMTRGKLWIRMAGSGILIVIQPIKLPVTLPPSVRAKLPVASGCRRRREI